MSRVLFSSPLPKYLFTVSMMVSTTANDKIKEYRTLVEDTVKAETPKFLDELITEAIRTQIPRGRTELSNFLKEETVRRLDKAEDHMLTLFNTKFDEHAPELRLLVKDLETEQGRQAFEDDLHKIMHEGISGEEIKLELDSYGMALTQIDEMIKFYASPDSKLTGDDQVIADLLSIIREMSSRSEITKLTPKKGDLVPAVFGAETTN